MSRYKEAGVVQRDLQTGRYGKVMTLREFKITKPTIICLGGDTTESQTRANNLCGTVERIIGLRVEGSKEFATYNYLDLVGFFYGKDKQTDNSTCFSNEDRDDVVNYILLPLCIDDNGNLLPLEEICKNFSLINFFTHCHGAYELYEVTKRLHKILLEKGLTNEEAHKIYAQSFHCSYASNYKESFYPTMYVYSLTDSDNKYMAQLYKENYGESLDGVSIKHDVAGKFLTENISSRNYNDHVHHDTITIFSSRLINSEQNKGHSNIYDEHSYIYLDRDKVNWRLRGKNIPYASNADLVSKMVAYAMAINIASSLQTYTSGSLVKRLSIKQLQQELEDLKESYDLEDLQLIK